MNEKLLKSMAHSGLHNYILPGLESWLIGGEGRGTVRLFKSDRHEQHPEITPHSHRFDFACLVLSGKVQNVLWKEDAYGDEYAVSNLKYEGQPGQYTRSDGKVARYCTQMKEHKAGDWYCMRADEIHSIRFLERAVVLFFEGPQVTDTTVILEPYEGERLATFTTADWMFKSKAEPSAEAQPTTQQKHIGYMVCSGGRYMYWPVEDLQAARTYCEDNVEPVKLMADVAELNKHEEGQL